MYEYSKLPVILQRYPFEEKIQLLQFYSKKNMDIRGVKFDGIKTQLPHPWELETILLFIVKQPSFYQKTFRNNYDFNKIVNTLRNYVHPKIKKKSDNLLNYLFISLALNQFNIQEYYLYKYYRYYYIYNYCDTKLNVKQEFYNKFGLDYLEVFKFGSFFNFIMSLDVNLSTELLLHLFQKHKKAIEILTISDEGFYQKTLDFTNDIYDYPICLKPSYIYPFIKVKGKVYLPLPHNLNRAISDSLYYRLTEQNNLLRDRLGSHVLEKYIYDLCKNSEYFDEIYSQVIYDKNQQKSPDVLCKKGNNILLIESKSDVPSLKIRLLDDDAIKYEITLIASYINQVYKQAKRFNKYNPFNNEIIDMENIYIFISLLEDSFIHKEQYFLKFKEIYNISDQEYDWVVKHIKVNDLFELEKILMPCSDMFSYLHSQARSDYFNFTFSTKNNGKIVNKAFLGFKKIIQVNYREAIEELKNKGLI